MGPVTITEFLLQEEDVTVLILNQEDLKARIPTSR
jgi:hypothetical protein